MDGQVASAVVERRIEMSELIEATRDGEIVTITLNNPVKRNALTLSLIHI